MNGIVNWYLGLEMESQGVVTLSLIMLTVALLGAATKVIRAYPEYRKYVASVKKAEAIERQQRNAAAAKSAELKAAFVAYATAADKEARMSDIVRQTMNL